VWRDKIDAQPKADIFLKRTGGRIEQMSHGEPEGGGDVGVTSIDVTQASSEEIFSLPKFVREGLKSVRTFREYVPEEATIKLVHSSGKQSIIFSLPVVVDENGEFENSLLFIDRNGHTRQRMACLTEISHPSIFCIHIFIVEGRRHIEAPTLHPSIIMDITFILPDLCQLPSMKKAARDLFFWPN
jgi:hypothetical protein